MLDWIDSIRVTRSFIILAIIVYICIILHRGQRNLSSK